MLRAVLGAALIVLGLTSLLGILAAPWILTFIAPGFAADPGQFALAVQLTRVMFPYLLLVGLGAFAMGVLNSQGRFFAAALGPAMLNVGMIATVLLLPRHVDPPILSLALGVLLGGVGQLMVQVPDLQRVGLLVAPAHDLRHPALDRIARLLLPAVFGLAAVQVMVFVNTLLASLLPVGSISFLYYADRVMEFPLGIFGIALASASLPAMARQAAARDTAGVASTLNFALRLALYVAVPATVGLVVLSTPITRVLFQRGRFSAEDTAATAIALIWYALGLVGFSGARIAAQAFYAVARPGVAVRLGALSIAVNLIAAVVLMRPMGHSGLACASSIGAYVNLLGLLWIARRDFGRLGGRVIALSTLRTLAASVPLALWCVAMRYAAPDHGLVWEAAWLAITIAVGAVVFLGASALVGSPERAALLGALPSGRRR